MSDLTVIYLTANNHPEKFENYHRSKLIDAIEGYPMITVTREKMIGMDNPNSIIQFIYDTNRKCHANMYFQLLQAAKLATTDYIATAEDDVLYSKEHFNFYRPPKNAVAYNMSRWSLFTWKPIYSLKQRVSNCTLIAPRKYLIEALEERFAKYTVDTYPPQLVAEVGRYEKNMGITIRNMVKVYSEVPVIQFNHPNGTDSTEHRKRLGQIKALDIPVWGRAEDLVKLYE